MTEEGFSDYSEIYLVSKCDSPSPVMQGRKTLCQKQINHFKMSYIFLNIGQNQPHFLWDAGELHEVMIPGEFSQPSEPAQLSESPRKPGNPAISSFSRNVSSGLHRGHCYLKFNSVGCNSNSVYLCGYLLILFTIPNS